jgi:biopolymer transport protein ExbB/TolQ
LALWPRPLRLLGMMGTIWGIFNSFPGSGGEKSACMAAIADLHSKSITPAEFGLAVAIMASSGQKYLSRPSSQLRYRNRYRNAEDAITSAYG